MNDRYWWLDNIDLDDESVSGEIRFALVSQYSDYGKLKKGRMDLV
jgi:hypothetical protein